MHSEKNNRKVKHDASKAPFVRNVKDDSANTKPKKIIFPHGFRMTTIRFGLLLSYPRDSSQRLTDTGISCVCSGSTRSRATHRKRQPLESSTRLKCS